MKHDGNVVLEKSDVKFTLGESEDPNITPGLEAAIKKMKLKEKSRFTMTPKYCYGTEGNKELNIPGNASLVYEVELSSFEKVSFF